MNDFTFWGLLDRLDWKRLGDDEAVLAPAVAALAQLPLEEIESFQQILAGKLYALDGRAWARQIGSAWWGGPNPVSVDGFLYARCAALTNGREAYEAVLADPTRMPKDLEFESLLYLAPKAWEAKTGSEADFITAVSYETYSNVPGWPPADPDPEVAQPRPSEGRSAGYVTWDYGKVPVRRLIRTLVTGDIRDPALDAYLAARGRVLIMTPGAGVLPPPAPVAAKNADSPPWRANIELWSVAVGRDDRRPTGFMAVIELNRVGPAEVSARLVSVEPPPSG